MRRGCAVVAVLLVCVLGACGDKDPSTGADVGAGAKTTGTDATAPFDACKKLSVYEVGAILGGTATTAGIFGTIGAGGGFDASKAGNATDGKVEDLSGIGDGAWVAVGRLGGGDNLQGQGVVAVGKQLINISIIQGNGLDESAIRDMEVKLLTLCAGKV